MRHYARLSPLVVSGQALSGLEALEPGDCLVAFSRRAVRKVQPLCCSCACFQVLFPRAVPVQLHVRPQGGGGLLLSAARSLMAVVGVYELQFQAGSHRCSHR